MPDPSDHQNLQVSLTHYDFSEYVSLSRWGSYWHQIDEVLDAKPANALYIGVGDGIVMSTLRDIGIEISGFDFDEGIGAAFVGDVRRIDEIVPEKSFDVVVCCQVLEHIPYEEFLATAKKLGNVARKRLIISLPFAYRDLLLFTLKLPKIPLVNVDVRLPRFWEKWKFDGQHYWELGCEGYSRSSIKRSLQHVGAVSKCFSPKSNPYHQFYIVDLGR